MSDTTANFDIYYPESTDDVALWEHFQSLAESVDDALVDQGVLITDLTADVGFRKVATANQSAATNSSALVTDSELTCSVTNGVSYIVRAFIIYRASSSADFKYAFSIPSGTLHWSAHKYSPSDVMEHVMAVDVSATDNTNNAGGAGTSTSRLIVINGVFIPSATGTLAFRFSSASATVGEAAQRRLGSWLEVFPA